MVEHQRLTDEVEIIRLNIERFRGMLRTELDESTQRAVRSMLEEFEAKLPLEGSPGAPTKML
jgi:hypothetical protein